MPGLLRDLVQLYQHIQDPNKAQRENLQLILANNPGAFQNLVDSGMADDPNKLMKTLGISNARFGGNKNAGTNLANAISNASLSEGEQAKRLSDFQDNGDINNIANASVSVPNLRAFNGMSDSSFQQQVPQIAQTLAARNAPPVSMPTTQTGTPLIPPQVLAQIQQANRPSLLSPQQQDILNKQRGLPTSLETQRTQSEINASNASINASNANANESFARAASIKQQVQTAQQQKALEDGSTATVDTYFANHPSATKRSFANIFQDPTVDSDVKTALTLSPKYSDRLKTDLDLYSKEQQRKLEAEGQRLSVENRDQWVAKMNHQYAIQQWVTYGGDGPQGYEDIINGRNTPDAIKAQQNIALGSPKDQAKQVTEYDRLFNQLQVGLRARGRGGQPTMSDDAIQAQISQLNNLANSIRPFQDVPDLKYDVIDYSKMQGHHKENIPIIGSFLNNKVLQTVDGTPANSINYKPRNGKLSTQDITKRVTILRESGFTPAQIAADSTIDPDVKAAYLKIQK